MKTSPKNLKSIWTLTSVCMLLQFAPITANAGGFSDSVKKLGGFFHHLFQTASTSISNQSSDPDSDQGSAQTVTDAQSNTPTPVAVVAPSDSDVDPTPVVQVPVAVPAPTSAPDHPQVTEVHFAPTTDNSKVVISGSVNSATTFLEFITTTTLPDSTTRSDLLVVPLVNDQFQAEVALQYGPGNYTVNSSVGMNTPRGVASYSDANQVVGTILNQDPIPLSSRIASSMIQSDDPSIIALANTITAAAQTPYDKAHAIHDWVSKNISYDYAQITHTDGTADYYTVVQTDNNNSAVSTMQHGKGICYGYANLTSALLRASGIPGQTITGPVLLTSADQWNESLADKDKPNEHAWNKAFVDGRWIIMDTTWDNVYGQKYFDPSPADFAKDHRQVSSM